MAKTRKEQQALYALQRRSLEAERSGSADVFLSPFDILRTANGVEQSYCTWPEGVTSSLPRADCIAFTGKRAGGRWYLIVPWGAAVLICEKLIERSPGLEPPRFATKGWPDVKQLFQLEQAAIIKKPEAPSTRH